LDAYSQQDLDEQTKPLVVAPHPGGVVPRFEPSGGEPAHDRLIAEMRAVYLAKDVPPYLDDKAQELLAEGRETFRQLQLERRSLAAENHDVHIFLWRGSQATAVFSAALAVAGLKSDVHDLGVSVSKIKESELMPLLQKLAGMGTIDPATVAEFVANIQAGKFREADPEDTVGQTQWRRGRRNSFDGGITKLGGSRQQRPVSKHVQLRPAPRPLVPRLQASTTAIPTKRPDSSSMEDTT
jgi:ATP-dependent Lhr-like helicase